MLPLAYSEALEAFRYDANPKAWELTILDTGDDAFTTTKLSRDSAKLSKPDRDNTRQQCELNRPGSWILFARHREQQQREITPFEMPLDKTTLIWMFENLELPMQYFTLIKDGSAAGAYTMSQVKSDVGSLRKLQIVVRVPHRPLNDAKAIWSIALSWDASTKRSSCFCTGHTDHDIDVFRQSLREWSAFRIHPMGVFIVLTGMLLQNYTKLRCTYDYDVFRIETTAGLRESKMFQDPYNWTQERIMSMTKEITAMKTHAAYMERRFDFAIKLCRFLIKCCQDLSLENFGKDFATANEDVQRVLEDDLNMFLNQLHQLQCLQKRTETVLNVVFSIVTQQDSRASVQLAAESKNDSSSMITIAVVTTIFLPGTYVAALFGTNMFDDKSMWLYWAITIPLTIVVMAVWLTWLWLRNKRIITFV